MKKLIFIFFAFGWIIVFGQTETIELKNMTGVNSECQNELQIQALELENILELNGTEVTLFLTKVYAPSVFMNPIEGLNSMEKVSKSHVDNLNINNIHFIAKVDPNYGVSQVNVYWKLSSSNIGAACFSKIEFFKEYVQKNLDIAIGKNPELEHIDCVIKDILLDLGNKLSGGCDMNAYEKKAWFEANEFEFIELAGMQLEYGEGALKNGYFQSSRFQCGTIDYTLGNLKYILSDGGRRQINALLEEVDLPFERRLIITDKTTSEALCDSIMVHEIVNQTCDVVIWLHFGDTFQGGKDEVGVKLVRKNAPGINDSYTYEQLEAQYKFLNLGIFEGLAQIDFRLKNYKDEIILMINQNQYSQFIPQGVITNTEYYAGFVSGVIDGMIETVDIIYLIGQATDRTNSALNPTSNQWWLDVFKKANLKRNFYEAYKEKWSETYSNWTKLTQNVLILNKSLSNDIIREEMLRNFCLIFQKAMNSAGTSLNDWGKDFLFINEVYDAGYAHGKLAFDLIPVGWLFKVGKGAIGTVKASKNIISEISETTGKSMTREKAREVLNEAIIDLTELAARLANKPNLKHWFDLDMSPLVKVELGKHMDVVGFLDHLELDLGTSGSSLKPFFNNSAANGIKAWEKLITVPSIRKSIPALETVSKWLDDGIEVTFKANGADAATIIAKNGDEVGEFVKDGANEYLVISDDFFVSSGTPKSFGSVTVNANTGEVLSNVGYVKNADGTLGFIEDVSAYGNATIQNAIKQRGALRDALAGISKTQDAHHVIPVQLLKENDVVKKAVEGGFSFNTSHNGLAIEKFVKSTGVGRHGPHPAYTSQIRQALDDWAAITPNYTSQQAKDFLDIITADIKSTITTSSGKINDLNLGL